MQSIRGVLLRQWFYPEDLGIEIFFWGEREPGGCFGVEAFSALRETVTCVLYYRLGIRA